MSNYTIWLLFGPSAWPIWCFLFAALALGLPRPLVKRLRPARFWLLLGLAVYGALAVLPLGYWLILPLETRFARPDPRQAPVRDIIVLAGGERLGASALSGGLELGEHGDRVVTGAMLANTHTSARLWIAGGIRQPRHSPRTDADWVADAWVRLGLDPRRIVKVNGTFDTCGNAQGVAARLPAGARPLLVTSAFHMPRAVACFRRAGLDALPYPTDYTTWPAQGPGGSFNLDFAENLRQADLALHEWAGLAYYRLRGRTDTLWPAP